MMPHSIEATLRARVDSFVDDLTEIIRQAALEAVREALALTPEPARRGPGRPRRTAKRATTRRAKKKTGKRIRRSAADLEATASRILAFVKANPGTNMTAMTKAMRKPAKDLRGPIKLLMADRKLRTEGQKRGTTYHAGAGGKSAKRKTAKRKTAKRKTAKRAGAKRKTRRRKTS
jgi:hypothetical protein